MTAAVGQSIVDIAGDLAYADWVRSRYTGWTRATWRALADAALTAVRPYASPGHARIDLPGPASRSGPVSDGLEGFARTFLLAAFRLSADGADDPDNVAEWYADGLAAGTDAASPYRWPDLAELNQARVECASIALALHETRPWIWDRLDDPVRQRIVDWMSGMNGVFVWDNNWLWFRAVTEAFLRSVGAPIHADDIDLAIARTDEWYVGDGWYSDGPEPHLTPGREHLRNFDNYNGWAMHFYPLWYCRMAGEHAEPGLRDRCRARLRRFLADAQYLVGANGAPLLQGRSLTYRYAMLAPFWAGAIFDATPLVPGLTRRLASGVVKHFVRNGCFDEHGLQTLGWYRPFPRIRQNYSGPGSPYWSSKGFAGLVLPADHPVWTDAEEAMPVERADVAATLGAPGWVVSGTRGDGVVRLACHGGDHADPRRPGLDDPVYARLAFSTHAAPQLSDAARAEPLDSHTALLDADGRPSLRRPSHRVLVAGRVGVSRYRAHWALGDDRYLLGPWVTTASVLRGAVEVRLARVDASPPTGSVEPAVSAASVEPVAPGPWRLRFGGWALASSDRPAESRGGTPDAPVVWVRRDDRLASTVAGLRGLTGAGLAYASDADPLGATSAVPWVATDGPVAFGEAYAAVVVLSGRIAGTEATGGVTLSVSTGGDGTEVTVRWADGETDPVRLDPP
ncbi:DUF2264 domain-containing protein [Rugosimonospora africana]|uniref:DUF2264 domain-containing protein n=1 Tax=Rugosimonospora africana TaxID=556532 RepID=A0A8J3VW00_9ACTN|nr:DUF2264 domain-containing protein [Rugosimonospora africana]GIH20860.1 hypothetical protein Raf01_90320 [Rugosimonospora africana]